MAMAVLFLTLAGCQDTPDSQEVNKEEAANEELVSEPGLPADTSNTLPQPEEQKEDDLSQSQEPSQNQSLPQENNENVEELWAAPQLELEIIMGPEYASGGMLCYYRVEAKAEGNPVPEIQWSKDDSQGAWGENISQVNLIQGQTYDLQVTAANSQGTATETITLEFVPMETTAEAPQEVEDIDYSNSELFTIEISLDRQQVDVYYKNQLIRSMICSGGTPEDPTPTGTYWTNEKIYYSWLPKYDVGAYYFVRFYGAYLFHSLPFDEDGNLIEEEAAKLGTPASHGCIRLKVEDARWLYESLPLGVKVNIH